MRFILLLIVLFSGTILSAQTIHSITFQETGDYSFGKDVVKYYIQSRKGKPYDENTVNADIKRLHGTGYFSDVSAETKTRSDGQVDLIFKLAPQAMLKKISFSGNKRFKDSKLRSKIVMTEGSPLNYRLVRESAEAIRKFYASEGHNDATVHPRVKRDKSGGATVEFVIRENLKLKINSVVFRTPKVFSERDLRGSIRNQSSMFSWVPLLELGLLDKKELQNDMVRLRDKYLEKGYLDFRVKDLQINPLKDKPEYADLVFEIEEGEPYRVGKVTIRGAERFPVKDLIPYLRIRKGDVYSLSGERNSIQSVERKYSPLGYADFRASAEKYPDYRTHTVDLEFQLEEGEPYKIRDIMISGNKWTKDHVIRRELAIHPGDPVDKDRVAASRSRLMGMGYFKKVETFTTNSAERDKKDVDFVVEENNFLNARLGGGFSDTDGVAGMVEISHKNMDILDPKNYFTGGGQRARILAMVGTERMNLEADFTEPWLFGIQLRWDVSGYWRNNVYEDWDERRIGVTTSLTKRIFDDFTSISGGYTFEQVKIHDMASGLSWRFQQQAETSYVGRIHLSLDRDTRNSALEPTSGYNVNLYGAITSRGLGASEDYYRFEVKAVNYYTFFRNWFTLSAGIKAGFLGGFDNDTEVPLYERYFLGGGDSVRGFPYRSIGPEDYNKDVYGGTFMYLGTVELSHPIYSFIRGAVFMDIGDATDSRAGPFNSPNIGVGYGLRIKLPVVNAPLRLDVAFPVLNNQDGVSNSLRFHFNMGFALF